MDRQWLHISFHEAKDNGILVQLRRQQKIEQVPPQLCIGCNI